MLADNVKYVVIKDNSFQKVIVFSELLSHGVFRNLNPISAGFVTFGEENGILTAKCYGESTALNIKSRPEDDVKLVKEQILQSEEDLF